MTQYKLGVITQMFPRFYLEVMTQFYLDVMTQKFFQLQIFIVELPMIASQDCPIDESRVRFA
jgi:hypothetical protein